MKHTLSVLVENKPGVLTRVTSLFARRGFNIDSLAVGPTEDPTLSRITIVCSAAEDTPLEQITKQLHKLINVIKVQDLDPRDSVDRELVLFKVNAAPERRHEIIEIANVFRAKIVDVGKNSRDHRGHRRDRQDRRRWRTCSARTASRRLARTGKIALSRGSRELARSAYDARHVRRRRGRRDREEGDTSMATIYYEKRLRPAASSRARKVAVIGYGSQGHAHALNLHDSGVRRPRRPARRLDELGQGQGSRAQGHDAARGRRRGRPHHDPRPRRAAGAHLLLARSTSR